MPPDEDHPQHQLRRHRAARVQEDHLPEHHQRDEGIKKEEHDDILGNSCSDFSRFYF